MFLAGAPRALARPARSDLRVLIGENQAITNRHSVPKEELERWARRAFRQWALRPGPVLTYLRMLLGPPSLWRPALEIGLESLGWAAAGG